MLNTLKKQFYNPSDEYSPIPFWFLNDQLTKEELIRQMHDFKDKGIMGFVIHPRIGIPREIAYMSPVYLDFIEAVVEEANRLNMTVFLYDEAMYPSGSAMGRVVEDNPEYASRGLKMVEYACNGNTVICVQTEQHEIIVSVQAIQKKSDTEMNLQSVEKLKVLDGKVQFSPPNDEQWSIVVFIETFSRGVIRGIHFGDDNGEPGAPASADLLNPLATRKFIALTHEKYYARLHRYFGNTIKAMFTDEPNMLGRRALEGLKPWTLDFLGWFEAQGGSELDLPVLWFDAGKITEFVRKRYHKAVNLKLAASFYKPVSEWCEQHGIALTGHPGDSMDIGLLQYFQIPGQDLVWRYIAPEDNKSLVGPHSTMGKCSSDAARHRGLRRNANECFGACSKSGIGWSLTADDMKWYMDWLFVRGVNLLIPHAFYYSIDGERRIHERPPDVGPNNIWWRDYHLFAEYMKRMSWLLTDSVNAAEIAVLCKEDVLPWRIVQPLFENQIEFNYLEEQLLIGPTCVLAEGEIRIAKQKYKVVLVENIDMFEKETLEKLQKFLESGGNVIIHNLADHEGYLPNSQVVSAAEEIVAAVDQYINRDFRVTPSYSSLRMTHIVKENVQFYILVNEGEDEIRGHFQFNVIGRLEIWDPWKATIRLGSVTLDSEHTGIDLVLERRESLIIAVTASMNPLVNVKPCKQSTETVLTLAEDWRISGLPMPSKQENSQLESWTEWPGMDHFSGTIIYENSFIIDNFDKIRIVTINLGIVHEVARLFINDCEIGVKMWSPYNYTIHRRVRQGLNSLRIEVTNSLSNRINEVSLPSGLLGPVIIGIEQLD